MKKIIFILTMLFNSYVFSADSGIDPQYLNLKVYQFSVSTDQFCTDPITIFENDDPSYEDLLQNPEFGNGLLANGTYNCVIIEFEDVIQFAPDENSDSGRCVAGTQETLDVCNAGFGTTVTMTDGSTKTCDDTSQRVTMYLSTAVTSFTNDPFLPPTDGSNTKGIPLAAALEVDGVTVGQFVVDGTGQIKDNSTDDICEMQQPAFTFSEI